MKISFIHSRNARSIIKRFVPYSVWIVSSCLSANKVIKLSKPRIDLSAKLDERTNSLVWIYSIAVSY